jgi:hypothetical protein
MLEVWGTAWKVGPKTTMAQRKILEVGPKMMLGGKKMVICG